MIVAMVRDAEQSLLLPYTKNNAIIYLITRDYKSKQEIVFLCNFI